MDREKDMISSDELLKYEIAEELGLIDKLIKFGWGGLTAGETGRIGGYISKMKRRDKK